MRISQRAVPWGVRAKNAVNGFAFEQPNLFGSNSGQAYGRHRVLRGDLKLFLRELSPPVPKDPPCAVIESIDCFAKDLISKSKICTYTLLLNAVVFCRKRVYLLLMSPLTILSIERINRGFLYFYNGRRQTNTQATRQKAVFATNARPFAAPEGLPVRCHPRNIRPQV